MNKLLIKIPTRNRPEIFFEMLEKYVSLATHPGTEILVSLDADDASMNNPEALKRLQAFPKVSYIIGHSVNKIAAINRDIQGREFDVLLVGSDDMEPLIIGYDAIILRDMETHYPDGDGALWYNDSDQQRVCTLPVLGKKYYDQFGYVYHPAYQSLWCDNEYTDIAKKQHKIKYMRARIIAHQRPGWGNKIPNDALYEKNDAFHDSDKRIYHHRRSKGFPR